MKMNFQNLLCLGIATLVIALFALFTICMNERIQEQDLMAYSGWCKLTGNEKELTFEEWKALEDQGLLEGR